MAEISSGKRPLNFRTEPISRLIDEMFSLGRSKRIRAAARPTSDSPSGAK